MKIKPLFDRVVLVPKTEERAGLYLPNEKDEQPTIGIVIACGNTLTQEDRKVNLGDEVLFDPYACHYFTFDDQTYILINQKDILGILEKGEHHE